MKKWVIAFLVATLAAVSLSIPVQLLRMEYNDQYHQEQRTQARDHLTLIREELQSELDNSLFYADFIEMIIRQNPAISEPELREYARFIVERNQLIDNVTVAKDGIIHFIYPSAGNEAVIGMDLFDDETSVSSIEQAVNSGTAFTQGPSESVQGGLKIFNRTPVFTESVSAENLWGFASVTVDFEELITSTLKNHQHPDYHFSMMVESENSLPFILGREDLFSRENVMQTITLPDNHWTLAVAPVNGWVAREASLNSELTVSYVLISIIFMLVFFFSAQYVSKRDLSRKDALTGLLNKHTFELSAKRLLKYSTQKNGILLIDFNDFKRINDEHGHLAGDRVLKESARRMKEIVKQSDRVGRIGGDEFMIMVRDVRNEGNLEKIADRIVAHVEQPVIHNAKLIDFTVSVGFMMTTNTEAFDNVYELVDKKMYKHKEGNKESACLTLE
ncbi:MAG: sensor domain-containing diguanylate cyclase [Alkalibacterium sp.]|nr:sensor domain-containing diguanylate cyclase [Alkalibacterium sp.]